MQVTGHCRHNNFQANIKKKSTEVTPEQPVDVRQFTVDYQTHSNIILQIQALLRQSTFLNHTIPTPNQLFLEPADFY